MTSKIYIPTFDATVIFIHDVPRKSVVRYVKTHGLVEVDQLEAFDDQFYGMTMELDGMSWLVYVPDTGAGDLVWLVRTLSHEANHVILQLMRRIGVEDDETICYAQDNLLGEFLKKAMKKKKKAS